MNSSERIRLASARLDAQYEIVRAAAGAGPACTHCAHVSRRFSVLGKTQYRCRHIAYTEEYFDPVNGEVKAVADLPAAHARAREGLCGPDGALFEPGLGHHAANLVKVAAFLGTWLLYGLAIFGLVAALAMILAIAAG